MLKRWVPLSELRPGDRIAVAREIPVFGKTPIPDWEATLAGLDDLRRAVRYARPQPDVHDGGSGHGRSARVRDGGFRLGRRSRTRVATAIDWSIEREEGESRSEIAPTSGCENLELNVGAADKFVPQIIFTAPEPSVRLFLQALFSGDGSVYHSDRGVFLEYYSKSRRLIEDVHHLLLRFGIFSLIREKTTAIGTRACKIQITDKDQILRFAAEDRLLARLGEAAAARGKGAADDRRATEAQEQLRHAAEGSLGGRGHRGSGWRAELERARHSHLTESIHADVRRSAGRPR